jgi:phosphate-selective porin OprO/OprP
MNQAILSILLVAAGFSAAAAQAPPFPLDAQPNRSSADAGAALGDDPQDDQPESDRNDRRAHRTKVESQELDPDVQVASLLAPLEATAPKLCSTVEIRGRIEAESVMAAQSAESEAAIGDLQNGFGFRRVRLGAQGVIEDSASWVSEIEMAGVNVRLRDLFVGFDAIPGVRQIRVGFFREPYSLEGMTSSNFMTLLERSPQNVLSPARNRGVCGYWWPDDNRFLFSLGAFRDGTGSDGQSTGDGDAWAYTTRLTALPIYVPDEEDFQLVHIGGAFSQRSPPDGIISFAPRTGSNLLSVEDNPGSPFLPALEIAANSYQIYNLQGAVVLGSFSIQSEWSAAAIQQHNAGQVFVDGAYVQVSYFLTGEHRGYNLTRGSFDQVQVLRPVIRSRGRHGDGFGAIEVATRFSSFDLTSSNLPLDVNGNPAATRLYEPNLGVNWYLNSNLRVMFDYFVGITDRVGFDSTAAHVFGVRTALYW